MKTRKLLILDSAYTYEMIKERQLQESILCRDLNGYFEHVWSVHPFATIIPPENKKNTYSCFYCRPDIGHCTYLSKCILRCGCAYSWSIAHGSSRIVVPDKKEEAATY